MVDIHLQLTARRQSLTMTQRQLAAIMGTGQSAISELERGIITPNLATLDRWARALRCTLDIGLLFDEDRDRDVAAGSRDRSD